MLWSLPDLPVVRQSSKPDLKVDKDSLEDQSINYTHLVFIDCQQVTEPCIDVVRKIFRESSICFRCPPLLRCVHEAIPLYRLDSHYSDHTFYNSSRSPVSVIREAKIKYPSLTNLTILSPCNLEPYLLRNQMYNIAYSKINVWTKKCSYSKEHEDNDRSSEKMIYYNLDTNRPFLEKEWYNRIVDIFKNIKLFE